MSGGNCKFEKGEKSSLVKKTDTKFGAFSGSFHCLPCFEPSSIQTLLTPERERKEGWLQRNLKCMKPVRSCNSLVRTSVL